MAGLGTGDAPTSAGEVARGMSSVRVSEEARSVFSVGLPTDAGSWGPSTNAVGGAASRTAGGDEPSTSTASLRVVDARFVLGFPNVGENTGSAGIIVGVSKENVAPVDSAGAVVATLGADGWSTEERGLEVDAGVDFDVSMMGKEVCGDEGEVVAGLGERFALGVLRGTSSSSEMMYHMASQSSTDAVPVGDSLHISLMHSCMSSSAREADSGVEL